MSLPGSPYSIVMSSLQLAVSFQSTHRALRESRDVKLSHCIALVLQSPTIETVMSSLSWETTQIPSSEQAPVTEPGFIKNFPPSSTMLFLLQNQCSRLKRRCFRPFITSMHAMKQQKKIWRTQSCNHFKILFRCRKNHRQKPRLEDSYILSFVYTFKIAQERIFSKVT